jgi:flagellar protein FliS
MSASPLELVCMLYDGAMESVLKAARCQRAGEIRGRATEIGRAMLILNELSSSLDQTSSGDLPVRLAELYDYMQRRLAEANIHQQAEPLEEVYGLLRTLREGWVDAAARIGLSVEEESPYAAWQ